MKISLNSLQKISQIYGSTGDLAPQGSDALIRKIGAQLAGIEETELYGQRFEGVIVARVVSCENHPNADRLHICLIDDGGYVQGVDRNDQGYVQVVCGASNVREGLSVAWLPPGVTVPSTRDKDPFVLEARELRGVLSNGMLASPRELTIGDSHEGLLELDADIRPGTSFAEAYNLTGDIVIDMENKMFTHRPDCFGWLGVTRELAGIQHMPYKSPEWYRLQPEFPDIEADELPLEFRNEVPELVPRFTAITLRDVTVKPSPVWLQIALSKVGIRPINNIVDYTNFFMLETGQPIHAYDYDKVMAQDEGADHATLIVRHPSDGERITLLSGKEIEPRSEAIMIATRDKLIGVGGVMGGTDTEVDENTHNIIIEVATFDMYSIRRTSMAHGLFTDAVARFNKGQSPLQNMAVLAKITDEIRKHANGKVASQVVDSNHLHDEVRQSGCVHPPVKVAPAFINVRLGLDLSGQEMTELLTNVEFAVETLDDGALLVKPPFWRTDIAIPEDIVEEIGRLYGYDHLPLKLPERSIIPAPKDAIFDLKEQLSQTLSAAGANEVLTYSFVHGDLLKKVGQDAACAFQLSNALSPNLQFYRLSVLPSLLEKVHANIKAGHDRFALFELGKAHNTKEADEENLPREVQTLAFVTATNDKTVSDGSGAAYYQALTYAVHLMSRFGVESMVRFVPLTDADLYQNSWLQQMTRPFDPARTSVLQASDGLVWGIVGEFKPAVRKALKMPVHTAGFEIDLDLFSRHLTERQYVKLSRFPKVEQDICLKVDADLPYSKLFELAAQEIAKVQPENSLAQLTPVDIYQRDDATAYKQVTLRLSLASYDRTLTDAEASQVLDAVARAAAAEFKAQQI